MGEYWHIQNEFFRCRILFGHERKLAQAKEKINLEEYKKTMENIYTTSVTEETKDEAPFVYKPIEEILKHITPTVEVTKIIKPIYNFKAAEEPFWKK